MKYKAVVFDLDGTLLYTLEDLYLATNHGLTANGLPPISREDVRRYVGNGYRQLARLASPAGTPDAMQEQVLAEFNAYYHVHSLDHTGPYPGIPELLERLRTAGLPMAVVSNKGDVAVQDLMRHFFPGCFSAVAGEREGIRRKPAPDTVNAVMEAMGVTAREVVYVGDSEVDVRTAANVGCDHIIVTWGYRDRNELEAEGEKVFADSCEELEQILLGEAACSPMPLA